MTILILSRSEAIEASKTLSMLDTFVCSVRNFLSFHPLKCSVELRVYARVVLLVALDMPLSKVVSLVVSLSESSKLEWNMHISWLPSTTTTSLFALSVPKIERTRVGVLSYFGVVTHAL